MNRASCNYFMFPNIFQDFIFSKLPSVYVQLNLLVKEKRKKICRNAFHYGNTGCGVFKGGIQN